MTKRTLRLTREPLGSLSDAELNGVVGGAYSGDQITCVRECVDDLTRRLTCYCTLVC